MTIPDQSLTIREIISRHTRGIPMDVQMRKPIYSEEMLPGETAIDFTDIEREREQAQETIEKFMEENEKRRLAKEKRDKEKEFENWKNEQDAKNTVPGTKPAD